MAEPLDPEATQDLLVKMATRATQEGPLPFFAETGLDPDTAVKLSESLGTAALVSGFPPGTLVLGGIQQGFYLAKMLDSPD